MEKKKKNVSRIYEYDCKIYPRMIWVAFDDCPRDVIKDVFEDMPYRDFAKDEAVNGFVMHNRRMKPEVLGGMLMMFRRSTLNAEIVAHEAVHAAMGICNYCGMKVNCDDEYQEYFAYLVGWIVSCVYDAFERDGNSLQG